MLGSSICRHFQTDSNYEVFGLGRSDKANSLKLNNYFQGDIADTDFIENLSEDISFDYIIHCAAIVNLKTCEENHALANTVHVEASKTLAKHFSDAIIIYISTDSVFNGQNGNYNEEDNPQPLNNYSRSKYHGELAIANINPKHYILRLNLYGFNNPWGGSLFEWAYNSLKNKQAISGFDNFIFNPLYTGQIAQVIESIIIEKPTFGIYHLGSDKPLSKYDFVVMVAKSFNLDISLIERKVADQSGGIIMRPENTSLDSSKLKHVLPRTSLEVETGLEMLKKDMLKLNII